MFVTSLWSSQLSWFLDRLRYQDLMEKKQENVEPRTCIIETEDRKMRDVREEDNRIW